MKKSCIIGILIALLIIVPFSCNHTITDSYVYPVLPSSKEWSNMSNSEKQEVCAVPLSLALDMDTPTLLETYLNHPLGENQFILKDGNEYLSGLEFLLSRKDLEKVIYERYVSEDYAIADEIFYSEKFEFEDMTTELKVIHDTDQLEFLASRMKLNLEIKKKSPVIIEIERRLNYDIARNNFVKGYSTYFQEKFWLERQPALYN